MFKLLCLQLYGSYGYCTIRHYFASTVDGIAERHAFLIMNLYHCAEWSNGPLLYRLRLLVPSGFLFSRPLSHSVLKTGI